MQVIVQYVEWPWTKASPTGFFHPEWVKFFCCLPTAGSYVQFMYRVFGCSPTTYPERAEIRKAGIEPATLWLKVRCSTNWAISVWKMEGEGFEPSNNEERIYSPSRLTTSLTFPKWNYPAYENRTRVFSVTRKYTDHCTKAGVIIKDGNRPGRIRTYANGFGDRCSTADTTGLYDEGASQRIRANERCVIHHRLNPIFYGNRIESQCFFWWAFFAVSVFINSSCRARTCDTMINSHVLLPTELRKNKKE